MRQRIVDRVRRWVGTPFRFNGSSPNGCDCVHIIREAISETGQIPNIAPYSPKGTSTEATVQLLNYAYRIPLSDILPGDILMLVYKRHPLPHFGIVTERQSVIHALVKRRQVVEDPMDSPEVVDNLVAAYRLKGL